MSAVYAWAFYDAVHAHSGGCQACGEDDEFSPNAEAFEETGEIICGDCWEADQERCAEAKRAAVSYGDGKKSPYGVTYADELTGEFS
jgi:hypothetical protein